MTLEQIARTYGMNDYYDQVSCQIYELSCAIEDENGSLLVPVRDVFSNALIGYARMKKVE